MDCAVGSERDDYDYRYAGLPRVTYVGRVKPPVHHAKGISILRHSYLFFCIDLVLLTFDISFLFMYFLFMCVLFLSFSFYVFLFFDCFSFVLFGALYLSC